MKSKLFLSLFIILNLCAPKLWAYVSTGNSTTGCIVISKPMGDASTDTARRAIAYPLLFLKGENGIEKNEKKAFDLLLDIEHFDSAKIWIAYFYEYGIGCEKSVHTADTYLANAKNNEDIKFYTQAFLNKEYETLFALRLADIYYYRTGKYKIAYGDILNNKSFKEDHPKEYERIIKEGKKSEKELVAFLIPIHTYNKDFEKAIALLDLIDTVKVSEIEYLFFSLIQSGDLALIEKFLSKKHIPKLYNEEDRINLYYAFCYLYGIGTQADEAKANELIDKYLQANIKDEHLGFFARKLNEESIANGANFVFYVANKCAKLGNAKLLANAYEKGIGCKENYEEATKLYCESINAKASRYELETITRHFKEICKIKAPSAETQNLVFNAITNNLNLLNTPNLILFYNFEQKGLASKEQKELLLKLINEEINKYRIEPYKYLTTYYELKAYCYQYGIGCEKNEPKAESLRLDMEAYIDTLVKNNHSRKYIYQELRDIYTSTPSSNFYAINCPALHQFYEQKIEALESLKNKEKALAFIENLSEEDKADFLKFFEIAELFKLKATHSQATQELEILYNSLIAKKSPLITTISTFTIDHPPSYTPKAKLNLSSLKLRATTLPLLIKAADAYCPELYNHAAYCYRFSRGTRHNKKMAAELYTKAGSHSSAGICYIENNDFDNALLSFQKAENDLSINSKIYLSESNLRNTEKANKYFQKKLAETESKYYHIAGFKYLESKYYNFLLNDRTYNEKDLKDNVSYTVLFDYAKAFIDGIYCERDLDRAVEISLKNNHNSILLNFICDIENNDPKFFWEALEKFEEYYYKKHNVKNLSSLERFKLIALDLSYGCERDEAKIDACIKNMGSYDLISIINNRDKFKLTDDLMQKLAKKISISPKDSLDSAMLNYLLGNPDKAKYALNQYHGNTNASKLIDLYMHTRPLEEIVKDFSKSKNPELRLAYATMLYKGEGCAPDKEKAREIFELTASRWENDYQGLSAQIWLWIYHTQAGNTQEAKALISPNSGFPNLYTYKAFPMLALSFKDPTYIKDLSKVYNLPQSDEYSQYFLSLMEEKYLSSYAEDLLEIYGQSPLFKNLNKKLEIRAKAQEKINILIK